MNYQTPPGFVDDLVECMLFPGLYYDGTGPTNFLLYADDSDHLARMFLEIRNTLDESGAHYTALRSSYQFRTIDTVIHQRISTLCCSHLLRDDVGEQMRGTTLNDIFLCADGETIARKVDHNFMMRVVPALYSNGLEQSSFLNRMKQGDFNMTAHIDTVHTNRQRLDKIRSVLHAADNILNMDSFDAISKQAALDALREASSEALGSLNAIEQLIAESGDMDTK